VRFVVHALGTVESTQSEVQRLAAAGAPEGIVVTAHHQQAGRGRRGHRWWDAPGESLLVSILLRPTRPLATVPELALVGGLAVAEALATADVAAHIRWPNDVLVGGVKVCGILAEAASDGRGEMSARAHHVILGIGINLNQTGFPASLGGTATSLRLATGRVQDAGPLLGVVLARLEQRYEEWLAGGFVAMRADWLAHALLPGQMVRLPDGSLGVGEDVRDDGVLLARAGDGRLVAVVSGGVVEEVTAHAAGH